jgi:hypothetical protein
LKIPIIKRAGGVAQGKGPKFKPQYQTHTKLASSIKYKISRHEKKSRKCDP